MISQISPKNFALRQTVAMFMPWVLVMVALGAMCFWLIKASGSVTGILIGVLCSGATLLGYAAWAVSNDWHGLIRTPKGSWVTRTQSGVIYLQTPKKQVAIPIAQLKAITLVQDWGWDTLKGVEESCLVLRLSRFLRICLPGSAEGFQSVLSTIRDRPCFSIKKIGE